MIFLENTVMENFQVAVLDFMVFLRTWGLGSQIVHVGHSVAIGVLVEMNTATNGHCVQNVLIKSRNQTQIWLD